MANHLVWPEGSPCDKECPGEWSEYHDGYSWGYEKGTEETKAINSKHIPIVRVDECELDGYHLDVSCECGWKAGEFTEFNNWADHITSKP